MEGQRRLNYVNGYSAVVLLWKLLSVALIMLVGCSEGTSTNSPSPSAIVSASPSKKASPAPQNPTGLKPVDAVVITSDTAPIYTKSGLPFRVKAKRGYCFKFVGLTENYCEVNIASGESRFIPRKNAKLEKVRPDWPSTDIRRKKLLEAILKNRWHAHAQATSFHEELLILDELMVEEIGSVTNPDGTLKNPTLLLYAVELKAEGEKEGWVAAWKRDNPPPQQITRDLFVNPLTDGTQREPASAGTQPEPAPAAQNSGIRCHECGAAVYQQNPFFMTTDSGRKMYFCGNCIGSDPHRTQELLDRYMPGSRTTVDDDLY